MELERFIASLVTFSDKLETKVLDSEGQQDEFTPSVEVCLADGTPTGLAFHGVPSGHEFTSFVLGLYNAAGPGQEVEADIIKEISGIKRPTKLMILVTLSCTMCPDLVVAAQRIASLNPNVSAHVYDIRYFDDLRKRYKVMSVPCLVINDEKVSFGKKNLRQVLELIGY